MICTISDVKSDVPPSSVVVDSLFERVADPVGEFGADEDIIENG